MLTLEVTNGARMVPAFLGFIGGAAAIAVGLIFLLFAFPSLGQPGELDFFFSQAAGGLLIILLGLDGMMAAALVWPGGRAWRALLILTGLYALSLLAALGYYHEWNACIAILAISAVTAAALRFSKNAACHLLLLAGLFGFALCQAAITLLPYGWKAWSVSGTLFLYSGLACSFPEHLRRLLLPSGPKSRRWSYLGNALGSLALIVLAIAALAHLPGPAGPGQMETGASFEPSLNVAAEKPDVTECGCGGRSPEDRLVLPIENVSLPGGISEEGASSIEGDMTNGQLRARIHTPGDVRTFPHGESVLFSAGTCGTGALDYLWRSSQDGIIGRNQSFRLNNLSLGWHNITLTVRNASGSSDQAYAEIAIAPPWVCGKVIPRPKYYPPDTPCQDIWPNASEQCQEMEVCHPDLDWIVDEAINACAGYDGDRKRCRGLYIINSFGPQARYIQGYAVFKACCSGYPECIRICSPDLAGTCSFRDGFNDNVANLSCRPEEWGVSAWRSDSNMSENSAVLGMFPTHATVNILQTGVCVDYAAAVTTMLRKAGYNKSEAFSTFSTGYDLPLVGEHPGHAYNLVILPGDAKYHIVDTTGNGDGINLGDVPGYFRFTGCFLGMPSQIRVMDWWVGYCSRISPMSYNDAGEARTPEKGKIYGCAG
ncbi:MAG: hypothetical protein A4E49_00746 [Methanosaeta sp. PtaU1.Bin112]|nr:MAG: hypothetical protein A4E49_00746 [Methanosaeta sp. PtaU1.Bin112]